MDNFELNDYIKTKIDSMPVDQADEPMAYKHLFLKLALDYLPNCSNPVIGTYEIPAKGIKYDGYYVDEDEKEFHLLVAIYYDDISSLDESRVYIDLKEAEKSAGNFLKMALSRSSSIGTDTEVGEHMQELADDHASGDYSIEVDIFTNATLGEQFDQQTDVTYEKIGKVHFEYHDAQQIVDSIESEDVKDLVVDFKSKYNEPLTALRVARTNNFDVYLAAIEAPLLAQVYKDHKSRLMDGNVRAYLKRTQKTNRGITQTLKNDPQDFVAYNNGISAVASAQNSDIRAIGDNVYLINALDRMQIVNGGQTTVTIYECSRDPIDLKEAIIPMKITVMKQQEQDADLISNIAVYANTQTAIMKSDLSSNKPYYKAMETLSRSIPCYRTPAHLDADAYYWFFERANGLYNTRKRIIFNSSKKFDRQYPEKNKFSKKLLAKVVMAYSCRPDIVCLGNERCFNDFNARIEANMVQPDRQYFRDVIGALILWRDADKIIKKNKLPIKAAVLPYTIAYLSKKADSKIDLNSIWQNQKITRKLAASIEQISIAISNYFVSVQDQFPNTLMYGRKNDCWIKVSNLDIPVSDLDCFVSNRAIDFFPMHPARAYISNSYNFNQYSTWENLLEWNQRSNVLSAKDVEKVREILSTIRISQRVDLKTSRDNGEKIFIKAVQHGYVYR